jgi:hypothetical protein
MTLPNKTEHRAIVDTHRHPIGPKLAAKMAERGLYDPKQEFPQTNAQDLICYREFFDLDYAMPKQREGGVTPPIAPRSQWRHWLWVLRYPPKLQLLLGHRSKANT